MDASLLRVRTQVGEREVLAIVDTAGSHSYIRPELPPRDAPLEKGPTETDLAAEDNQLGTTGRAWVNFDLQGGRFSCPVFVAPKLRGPLILGLDWLRQEEGLIDLVGGVLRVGKHERVTVSFVAEPVNDGAAPVPVNSTMGSTRRPMGHSQQHDGSWSYTPPSSLRSIKPPYHPRPRRLPNDLRPRGLPKVWQCLATHGRSGCGSHPEGRARSRP